MVVLAVAVAVNIVSFKFQNIICKFFLSGNLALNKSPTFIVLDGLK